MWTDVSEEISPTFQGRKSAEREAAGQKVATAIAVTIYRDISFVPFLIPSVALYSVQLWMLPLLKLKLPCAFLIKCG
jgi:hypothetical protein